MTVSTTATRVAYTSDGVTLTPYAVPFTFEDASDLVVTFDGATKALTTHYTVSGGDGSTGTVSLVAAPSAGVEIVIRRQTPRTRTSNYVDNDRLPAATLNADPDKLTRVVQEIDAKAGRAMRAPDHEGAMTLLPSAEDRAGKALMFDDDGQPYAAATTILAVEIASEAEAEAGLQNTKSMTALRTKQAIQDGAFLLNPYGSAARTITNWHNDFLTPLDIDEAAGDGVTSASAAINEALSKGPPVLLPDTRTWLITDPIEIGDGQVLYSQNQGTALLGPAGATTIKLQGDARISNIRLVKNPATAAPLYHIEHDVSIGELIGGILEDVQFENGSFAVYTYAYSYKARGLQILNCRATDVANPLFFENLSNARIDGFKSSGASGSNILFKSGRNTRIVNYDLDGGLTGITMLGGQSVTGNGAWSLDIGPGSIRSPREEFISFDCNGADPDDCTMRERAQVASKTSDANFYYVTLNAPTGSWAGSSGVFVGAYMCFVDGAVAGGCYEIYSNSNGGQFAFRRGTATGDQQMRAAAYAAIEVGDLVVVGSPFLGAKVNGAVMEGATGADNYMNGVLFYGGVFGARATNIKANFRRTLTADYARGVTLSALSGVNSSGSYVSGGGSQRLAPVMNCTVDGSFLDGCDMALEPTLFGGADSPIMLGNRTTYNTGNGSTRICVDNQDLSDGDLFTP